MQLIMKRSTEKLEKLTAENEVLSNENDRLRQWIKAKGYDLQSALE